MSSSSEESLMEALEELDLKNSIMSPQDLKPDVSFKNEIERSSFLIFRCIADLGYYGWKPEGPYKSLADATASEIKQHIDLHMKPPNALRTKVINKKLPKYYASLSPQEYMNKYPHNPSFIPSLYVSVKEKGVKIQDVDFVFGGSTLEMFVNKSFPSEKHYVTTLIHGTNTILVANDDEYIQDYSDPGFQFERLVTNKKFEDLHDLSLVEHLQLMCVSGFHVLFVAEVDAMDENGKPIERTQSHPKQRGTQLMFQMISNGCKTLYSGKKRRGKLLSVKKRKLSKIIRKTLSHQNIRKLQENITECMERLRKAVQNHKLKKGYFNEICFEGNFGEQVLVLKPLEDGAQGLLPPKHIIEELLL
jgi:hypothetical protein